MHTVDIIVLIVVALYAGYRIYQKYFKKEIPGSETRGGNPAGSSEDDDYKPYSNK